MAIFKDELVEYLSPERRERCPYPLQGIEVYDPEKNKFLVLLINHLDWNVITTTVFYKASDRLIFF